MARDYNIYYDPICFLFFLFHRFEPFNASVDYLIQISSGTGIEIIGTPDWFSDGGFTFQIDGGAEEVGSSHGDRAPNTTFVRIQDLPNTNHTFGSFITRCYGENMLIPTLVFKNGGPTETKFILDRIQYTTEPLSATPYESSHRNLFQALRGGYRPMPTNNDPHESSLNLPALIGGIVGGLALLGALIAVVIFVRRRRQAQAIQQPMSPTMSMLRPEPFFGQ